MYHMTDRELTQLQETGRLTLPGGYCIGSILEGLDTLGIPPAHAFLHRGTVCEVVLWIDQGRRPSSLTDYLVGMFPESERETVRRALTQEPPRPLPTESQPDLAL